jgi:hypothetical protein
LAQRNRQETRTLQQRPVSQLVLEPAKGCIWGLCRHYKPAKQFCGYPGRFGDYSRMTVYPEVNRSKADFSLLIRTVPTWITSGLPTIRPECGIAASSSRFA